MPKDRLLIKAEVEAYAQILLDMGEKTDSVVSISAQLEEMQKVVRMHPGLRDILDNSSIDEQARVSVIGEIFKEFTPDVIEFCIAMAQRREISLLPRVAELYDQMIQDKYNMLIMDVATVIPLDDELRDKIKTKFSAQFGKEIVLREHVDPWLLGGMNVRAQGRRVDCCTATRIEKVRAELSSAKTGGER